MSHSRNSTSRLVVAGLAAVALAAAGAAWALSSDKSQPINVQADHGDFIADANDTSSGTSIYTGHVVITQGSIVITGDKAVMRVVNNELRSADVTGTPATFQQQPDQGELIHGVSQELTYDASLNDVNLITLARLEQGLRLMTADHIHYNTDTQHMIAQSNGSDSRVHVTLPPKASTTKAPASVTAAGRSGKRRRSVAPASSTLKAPAAATRQAPPAAATHSGAGA